MSRRLSGFLADNSQDQLQRMLSDMRQARERAEEDVREMVFEERVVEEALARKQKRRATGRRGSGKSSTAMPADRMTRERVLDFVNSHMTGAFNSTILVNAMAEEGIKATGEGVRQHLRRLADEGHILREGKGFAPLAATRVAARFPVQASPNGVAAPPGEEGRELRLGVGT